MRSLRLLLLAILCAVVLDAPRAFAALCGETQQPCNPNKMGSKCYKPKKPCPKCKPKKCNKCTKSPGYVGIGAYEIDATDLTIPSAAGFPLLAMRRYDSTHQFDGPLGHGWISSFEPRLFHAAYLFAAPNVYRHEVEVVLPDTEHFEFTDTAGTGNFTPEAGRYDKLVKNADGTWDLTLQHTRSVLHFDAQGLLTSMEDDFGNEQLWTYDASGRLQRVADNAGSGRFLDIVWGADGRISHVVDHTGRQIGFTYDTDGVLTEVTNPLGQKTEYDYVPGRFAPLLSQIRDNWDRVVTTVTWDEQDRVTSYTEAGETFTYAYGTNSTTTKTDSAGNAWVYPYDDDGLVTEDRLPGGAKRHTTFDGDGNLLLATDEMGVKTHFTYNTRGNASSMTADHQGTSPVRWDYTYHATYPDELTSALPKVPATGANHSDWQGWKFEHYGAGSPAPGALYRILRVRNDGITSDVTTTYTYDARGRITNVSDAAGATTDYSYDTQGNLITITAPANNAAGSRPTVSLAYDSVGRVTKVTNPLGHESTYVYDAADRMVAVTLPKPAAGSPLDFTSHYSFDNYDTAQGLAFLHMADPNGVVTKRGYDAFGRLRTVIDALGNVTSYAYAGRKLHTISDANGNVTTLEYDGRSRLTGTVFPDGARETYGYRADGLLLSQTDRKGQAVTYSYDSHKRMTRESYPNASAVEYSYAGQKLTQVHDTHVSPAEIHAFSYDDSFRVISNTQGPRGTVSYTYTATDAVAAATVTGGPVRTFDYYLDGSMRSVNWNLLSGAFTYEYRLDGRHQKLTLPNSQTRQLSYDDQGRVLQVANVHPVSGTIATFDYDYDLDHATGTYTRLGQRVTLTANVPAQGLVNAVSKYFYDDHYQLKRAEYPSAAPFNGAMHAWTHDAIGNRTAAVVNGVTSSYTYQNAGTNTGNWHRLSSDGTQTYTYDANGNLATQSGLAYSWDFANRLTEITGTTSASYAYDYLGRRTSKTVGGVTTTYLYDGEHIVRENGSSTIDYLFGRMADEPLALFTAGAVSYFASDALGSTIAVGTHSGSIQNHYTYDAWGDNLSSVEAVAQPFRYTGREVGDVPGSLFYRARFYQPSVGRFISEDPLGRRDAADLFAYVRNAPVQFTDPSGLSKFDKKFGLPDAFWTWYHQEYKQPGDPDIQSKDEAQEAYDEWVDLGQPNPKQSKKKNPKPAQPDPTESETPKSEDNSSQSTMCVPCKIVKNSPTPLTTAIQLATTYTIAKTLDNCKKLMNAIANAKPCKCG